MSNSKAPIKLLKYVLFALVVTLWSIKGWAFSCRDARGNVFTSGYANIYANVTPSVGTGPNGSNLVVSLSDSISCKNDNPASNVIDHISAYNAQLSSALNSYTGYFTYYGSTYNLPLYSYTNEYLMTNGNFEGLQITYYLSPIGTASGVLITSGTKIAEISLHKYATFPGNPTLYSPVDFVWSIIANNTVIIPTGGCDVSSRDVAVNLPDYPGGATNIPLTVRCPSGNKNLAYYLTGTTTNAGSGNNIFANSASTTPAQGVGVQISNSSGVIAANSNISLGTVGTNPVNLGLTANYADTGGQVIAGNVQSVIGVTFLYQ